MSCQSTPKEAMEWVFEKFGLGFPSLIGHKHLEKKKNGQVITVTI